ncbi:DUF2326 domain-containing protein [Deferribacter abyssi]|uniref:DUF2326 domain-containing protein n=1 Tax=Deferribacter abyssi TaxID=213806 RepID=UPI003C1FF03D
MGLFTLKSFQLKSKSYSREIIFKKGINIILAIHSDNEDINNKNTYNGVGKTLLIKLIHYCLGADKKNYLEFIQKLPDWEFMLSFAIGKDEYNVIRANSSPDKVVFNGEKVSVDYFNNVMKYTVFSIPDGVPFLSFRTLLPFFIRKDDKKYYIDYDKPTYFHTDYEKLLANGFLLGISPFLIARKAEIKEELNKTHNFRRQLENDPDIKKIFFSSEGDVNLKVKDLEEQIASLEKNLKEYKIAKDYEKVKEEADLFAKLIEDLENKRFLIKQKLEKIKHALDNLEKPDFSKEKLEKMYEEVNIYFSDKLNKRLEELESFYKNVIKNRQIVLLNQLEKLKKKLVEITKKLEFVRSNYDEKMRYLGEHKALDMAIKVKEKLENLKRKKEKLEKYSKLLEEYRRKELKLREDLLKVIKDANDYTEKAKNNFEEKSNFFRMITKRLYPEASSGLTINVNEGQNKILFDISAKIDADASYGINKAKIFAYDNTLFFKGEHHNIGFLFHDSVLFDGVDEIQVTEMFRFVKEMFKDNKQYIVTLNQDKVEILKKYLDVKEFKEIIEDNIILILRDNPDTEKLLGNKINLKIEST